MKTLKYYIPAIILGIGVFLMLQIGCSKQPEIKQKIIYKSDTSHYNNIIDSLSNEIMVLKNKKNPLLNYQKVVRKRVDSLIYAYIADTLCNEDSLITIVVTERTLHDSIQSQSNKIIANQDTLLNAHKQKEKYMVNMIAERDSAIIEKDKTIQDLTPTRTGKVLRRIAFGAYTIILLLL